MIVSTTAQPNRVSLPHKVVSDVGLPSGGTRRQLTVRGIRLGELIGKRFRVEAVLCYGVGIREPCLHLQQLTRPRIIKELVHRGGINADILNDGVIAVGDEIAIVDERVASGAA